MTISEKETRRNIMSWAESAGCKTELEKIFSRFDEAMKHCKTEDEKKAIAAMGVMEIDKFFGKTRGLTINGEFARSDEENRKI